MAETADIAVIDGEDAGTTPWEFSSLFQQGGNTIALNAAAAIHESNGYRVTFDGTNSLCAGKKNHLEQTNYHARYYFKLKSGFHLVHDGDDFTPISLMDGGVHILRPEFYYHSGSGKFGYILRLTHNGGTIAVIVKNNDDIFTTNTKYYLELHYVSGALGTGGYQLWIDGVSEGSDFATYATSNYKPDEVRVGSVAADSAPAAGDYIDLDDLLLSTTGPIGPYAGGGNRRQLIIPAIIQ